MPSLWPFALRLGRWLRGTQPVDASATTEQNKLAWATGLLTDAVSETRTGKRRTDRVACDWTSPNAYWQRPSVEIDDDFEQFVARLRAMSDEDVAMAFRFLGGEGPRAAIIAAEMRRRNRAG